MTTLNLGRVAPVWQGAWNSGTAYTTFDVVADGGSSFIALQDVPAATATSNAAYWGLLAQAGTDGVTQDVSGKLDKAGDTMTGTLVTLGVEETLVALSGTTPNLDLAAGTVFSLSTTGATTFSQSNAPTGPWARTLHITAGGAHGLTFPASWDWGDAGVPDALATSGDIVTIHLDSLGGNDAQASQGWRKTV